MLPFQKHNLAERYVAIKTMTDANLKILGRIKAMPGCNCGAASPPR
jgi:hypothetical protein